MNDRVFHKRLPDFEAFDRIELSVVPRWKTSGLSGDEWRQSVSVRFLFKGEQVHETWFGDMQAAILFLGSEWVKQQEPIPGRVIEIENEGACDQPSCTDRATVRLRIKRQTSPRGELIDPAETRLRYFRQFCDRHRRRGDCSREDCDDNYEAIE